MRKIIQRSLNKYCRWRIGQTLPGVLDDLDAYKKKSNTTGTQWITLWMSVKSILKHRPEEILESGTGSSTMVLAATVQKLKAENPNYNGRVTSMESVGAWHEIASKNLPEKYRAEVEIILGPREKFEMGFFRGYSHSNIPNRNYGFILLDAPAYDDENGLSFCADVFKIMDFVQNDTLHGVSDGRASSVFVLQTLYGPTVARYYHSLYAASFSIPRIDFRDRKNNTPKDWRCTPNGRLVYKKFRKH
ncbi:MAG: hypothetical protein JJ868_12685 [Shimia sp.]|uniref:hypothetical protein n=1 Tax=Shimia sp. TaxID=1954381 RepID=UPI001A01E21D|nr:hypothetical protein [Shimia sp.]MBE1292397.1 hypothetical protein [Paracoccaceae bacterium]MBO6898221.1 hypothetical protein [Shimia sp.]